MKKNVFEKYYEATVGRYYSNEQRLRLISLFAFSEGIEEISDEYEDIVGAIKALDGKEIKSYAESNSFKFLNDFIEKNPNIRLATDALVSAHKKILNDKNGYTATDKLDWISLMRDEQHGNNSIIMDRALFEFSCGNIKECKENLKELVKNGELYGTTLLAHIYFLNQEFEDAFYYFSLIKRVYDLKLKIPLPKNVEEKIKMSESKISAFIIDKILRSVEDASNGIMNKAIRKKIIGFSGPSERRNTCELE